MTNNGKIWGGGKCSNNKINHEKWNKNWKRYFTKV
jgi:hypothetical protein